MAEKAFRSCFVVFFSSFFFCLCSQSSVRFKWGLSLKDYYKMISLPCLLIWLFAKHFLLLLARDSSSKYPSPHCSGGSKYPCSHYSGSSKCPCSHYSGQQAEHWQLCPCQESCSRVLPRVTQMLERLAVPLQHTVLEPILLRIHKMQRCVQSAALIGVKKLERAHNSDNKQIIFLVETTCLNVCLHV